MSADFDGAALGATADRLRGDGFTISTMVVDVSEQTSLDALAAEAASLGRVSKIAHTAGLSPVQASTAAVLRVDLARVAYSLDAFARVVAEGGAGVVIASMAGTLAAG